MTVRVTKRYHIEDEQSYVHLGFEVHKLFSRGLYETKQVSVEPRQDHSTGSIEVMLVLSLEHHGETAVGKADFPVIVSFKVPRLREWCERADLIRWAHECYTQVDKLTHTKGFPAIPFK